MADTRLSGQAFHDLGLADWRFLVGAIEANFTLGSYAAAGTFAGRVAAIADEQNHHPTIHLTYPGVVHVASTSHDVHGVSPRDVRLAEAVSAAARQEGATPGLPTGSASTEIAIDALDIDAVRPFWKAVLDYVDARPRVEGDIVRQVEDPTGIGPAVWFQQMDSPRPERNRIHLDVVVPHDVADARLAAALAAGGHLVSDARARAFWVLADVEGNEACICT
jgi:4a-hydroxytetrahydrobiopterin dehydratase